MESQYITTQIRVDHADSTTEVVETRDERTYEQIKLDLELTRIELDRMRNDNVALLKKIADSTNDFDRLCDALLREAEDRDWCSMYDDFVADVNRTLTVHTIPTREQEFDVTMTVQVTLTTTVNTSRDDVEDTVREMLAHHGSSYGDFYVSDYMIDRIEF